MPDAQFQWHPSARAFVAGVQVTPCMQAATAQIPPTPLAAAFSGLANAFGTVPFCVTDSATVDLCALPPSHFATLTGGTSGAPKVIARSQASWTASFETNAALFDYGRGDSIAVLGALSHSLALYGVLEALHLGMDIHALSDLGPRAQSTQLHDHKCAILYATPTQLRLFPAAQPLPALRLILCGGGALDAATQDHIARLCPNAALHVFYGAAETSFVTLGDASTPEGSVGRAYPNADIAVRDKDAQGIGSVWVRSPYLFDHYLQGDSPHTRRNGDWTTVGERGHLDPQGNLFLKGRAGRVMNVADQTVYPEELEAAICALTHAPYCAVMARADTLRGQHIIAVLPGPEDAGLRQTLPRACTTRGLHPPREVLFLEPFPILPSGKPDLQQIATLTGAQV
ncbi:AMP-binding protein [Sulfitobacter sp. HNIBRBA2951]|uniref:AMP-binding protein n=1 Tax=Sulfitobacter aquimarinus TaxID=3158557 RepID=UPI0032DFCFB3